MAQSSWVCPSIDHGVNLLFPLDRFYERTGRTLPSVRQVSGREVPDPYKSLLVGDHDMTPTLEAFHRDRIQIHVLERSQTEESLMRLVVLTLEGSDRPVEFGAIIIHLSLFPPDARACILGDHMPLGTILSTFQIEHVSTPLAFLCATSDELIEKALRLPERQELYGRRNMLLTPGNEVLADIVEILPP